MTTTTTRALVDAFSYRSHSHRHNTTTTNYNASDYGFDGGDSGGDSGSGGMHMQVPILEIRDVQVGGVIGRGGFGKVRSGLLHGQKVALKAMYQHTPLHHVHNHNTITTTAVPSTTTTTN